LANNYKRQIIIKFFIFFVNKLILNESGINFLMLNYFKKINIKWDVQVEDAVRVAAQVEDVVPEVVIN
jgi:hypothetical protein